MEKELLQELHMLQAVKKMLGSKLDINEAKDRIIMSELDILISDIKDKGENNDEN